MDWRAIRFDWNRARAFLVTAEEGSFSAAARALDMTQPTIGRQVAALEEELHVSLFERVGTRLELTATGLDLLEHVRAMGDSATRFSLTATGQSTSVEGNVTITASEATAAFLLPPVLAGLRRDHPGIEVEIVASNEARDLHRREADIAIRHFQASQPDLIARKIRDMNAYFYAAPSYIEATGPFDTPADLSRAELFAFDRTSLMLDSFTAMGLEISREQLPIMAQNHLVQWELCKHGLGVCMMMQAVGDAEPGVRKLLPQFAIPVPIWLVSHRELRTSRRIRIVFDALAEVLSEEAEPPVL